MGTVIPSLGGTGWISDVKSKMVQMFSHALVSDYSQSNLFKGSVTSIPKIIAIYGHDQGLLVSELEAKLKNYYISVFSNVDVKVIARDIIDSDNYALSISVEVTENGEIFQLASLADVNDSVLGKVIREINS